MRAFQSTRPVKGATSGQIASETSNALFQSTRPVKGATMRADGIDVELLVSIHAPREGRDPHADSQPSLLVPFQSTRPVKGATRWQAAARGESCGFNPRAP